MPQCFTQLLLRESEHFGWKEDPRETISFRLLEPRPSRDGSVKWVLQVADTVDKCALENKKPVDFENSPKDPCL